MAGQRRGFCIQSTNNLLSDSKVSLYWFLHEDLIKMSHASLRARISTVVGSVRPTDFEKLAKHLASSFRKQPPIPASSKLPVTALSTLNFSSPLAGPTRQNSPLSPGQC
ncbi:hypothetical protein GQ457_17G011270 [Hibiscus cannabinus]